MKISYCYNIIEIVNDSHIIQFNKSFADKIITNLKNIEFNYYLKNKYITCIINYNNVSEIYKYKIDIDRFSITGICKPSKNEYSLLELKEFCNNLIKNLNDNLELFN